MILLQNFEKKPEIFAISGTIVVLFIMIRPL